MLVLHQVLAWASAVGALGLLGALLILTREFQKAET